MKLSVILTLTLLITLPSLRSQILINEYSCANLNQYADDYGKYEDWVEIYNTSASTINLSGYYLSDDSLNLTKWAIPTGTQITGHGFLVFWASGRNSTTASSLHTNFKLTQTKGTAEYLLLCNPSGNMIDYVRIKKTKLGHSRGLTNDGINNWSIFTNPTYNASNNTATPYSSYAERPQVSTPGGFYASPISISITSDEPSPHTLRYTTDGTLPTSTSTAYSGPINISSTTVLKVVSFSTYTDVIPSLVEFNTYFINVNHTLPVMSIAGNELDYLANGNNSLRPHGSIEYFDTLGDRKASSYGEYNSHGQDSWINDQRSVDFVARDEMGYSNGIKEKLFKDYDRDKFQRVILRAAGDDNFPGTDWSHQGCAHLRDAFFQNLCRDGGLNLDVRKGSKCVVYLNGTYWGVYDIREIPDDHDYTDYNYGQGKYDIQYILTWGWTWAEYGGSQALSDWSALRTFILSNDMSIQANYDYVTSQLDVTSLADYVISHSLSVSSDWLNYNTGWWRGLNPAGGHQKWGYILWDNDASFAYYINYTGIPDTSATASVCNVESGQLSDPEDHIGILVKLRDNPEFNQYYISRYIDLLNTTFSCDHMLNYLDSLKNLIQPEMQQHVNRWTPGFYSTYAEWEANYARLRNFVSRRCGASADVSLDSCYNLTGPYDVVFDVETPGAGNVKINSIVFDDFPYTGTYFGGIDLNLEALTNNTGLPFQNWSIVQNTLSSPLTSGVNGLNLTANDTIRAFFGYPSEVSELSKSGIQLQCFPTVFHDQLWIKTKTLPHESTQLKLVNALGIEVLDFTQQIQNSNQEYLVLNIDQTQLSSGIYFMELKSGHLKSTIKLIHQH